MRRRYVLALAGLALVGCVVGREGILDSEGGIARRDGSFGARDGAAGLDGSTPSDAMVRDTGVVDGSGPRDGSRPMFELVCDDGLDNDMDGLIDCADEDCADAPCDARGSYCVERTCGGCRGEPSETSCGDGADEDCDGLTDCADPDCNGALCGPGGVVCGGGVCPCPSGFVERACSDGLDDDCDGLIDCEDPDCEGRACAGGGLVCTSGACTCMESVEFCNDLDENCDGIVDNGCPRALSLCCPTAAGSFGETGGTAFADPCPMGTVLMGIAGGASARLDRLQPICAALVLETDRDARPEFTYPVRRGAPIVGAMHGGAGGTAFDDRCPGNDVVIGIRGSSEELGGVRSIALQCGTVTVARAGFSFRVTVAPSVVTPTRGGASGSTFSTDCPGGAITDVSGRAGTAVERLTFTCRQLQLQTN